MDKAHRDYVSPLARKKKKQYYNPSSGQISTTKQPEKGISKEWKPEKHKYYINKQEVGKETDTNRQRFEEYQRLKNTPNFVYSTLNPENKKKLADSYQRQGLKVPEEIQKVRSEEATARLQDPALSQQLGISQKEIEQPTQEQIQEQITSEQQQIQNLREQGYSEQDIQQITSGQMYSGGVMPLTAGDVTDLVGMFMGVGIAKTGAKIGLKGLSRISKVQILEKATKKGTYTIAKKKAFESANKIKNFALGLSGKQIVVGTLAAAGGVSAVMGVGKLISGGLAYINIREFQNRVDSYQQSFNTIGEQSTEWTTKVREGRMEPLDGIKNIEINEKELDFFEGQLKQLTISEFTIKTSGEYIDVITDLREKKIILQDAKSEMRQVYLRGQYPLIDEATLNKWLANSEKDELAEIQREYEQQMLTIEKAFPQSQQELIPQ